MERKEKNGGEKKGCRQRWRGTENRNLPMAPMRPEDSKPSRQAGPCCPVACLLLGGGRLVTVRIQSLVSLNIQESIPAFLFKVNEIYSLFDNVI